MAILLGFGDAFHLIPRVISHLSPIGFDGHAAALSWGQFVTSITMTFFYLLYYHYYASQSGDYDKNKKISIYLLAAARIILVLMPQNNWGVLPENYLFGIYRNIPFLLMGILLVFWSHKNKSVPGLKHMDLLISLSFLFYIPVVLFSNSFPAVGALMMPKTVSYVLIVWLGFRHFVRDFNEENLFLDAITFLIMGLIGGVFYREFTKFYAFNSPSHLGKIHVHIIVLGFIFSILQYLLIKDKIKININSIKKPFYFYAVGLTFSVVNMIVIGIYEVVSKEKEIISRAVLDGTSGLGHIVLGLGIVWLFIKIYKLKIKLSA